MFRLLPLALVHGIRSTGRLDSPTKYASSNCKASTRRNTVVSCYLFLDFDGVLHPEMCNKGAFFSQLPLLEAVLRDHPSVQGPHR